jgi:cyanoexosortase A
MFYSKQVDWPKLLQEPTSWLLALTVTLAALHLTILDFSGQPNLMSISLLMWLAIASLLWDKRQTLNLNSGAFSSALGATLIALVLLRSISPAGYHLYASPLISGIGLALMASGIKGLRHYGKELFILTLLALYSQFSAILNAIDLPTLTAKFGNFALLLSGFPAYRDGVIIALPTGKVEVYGACSGVESIILMLYIACLFLLLIPLGRLQQLICLGVAVLLGFVTNGVRVALMAWLVAYANQEAFNYWHGDDGSLIFAIIAVGIFGLFCWFAYVRPLAAKL